MSSVMVCIVGEQPVPNLLPVRHCKPSSVVFVYSDTTKQVHDNLVKFFRKEHSEIEVKGINIPPYDLVEAYNCFKRARTEYGWDSKQVLFNITGGTKPMSFAGFLAARDLGAQIVYLQSEGGRSLLHFYKFNEAEEISCVSEPQEIESQINIKEYLELHGFTDFWYDKPQNQFENIVAHTLRQHLSEEQHPFELVQSARINPSLEIDAIIRYGNQVGVAEMKKGKDKKAGIDQLNTVTRSEYLGKYTKRFLILGQELNESEQPLRDVAAALGIKVIELPSFSSESSSLSEEDKKKLADTVLEELGAKLRRT